MPRTPKPTTERFWEKVDRRGPDECWLWLAARQPNGYGRFTVDTSHDYPRGCFAHRFAYELLVGPIPAGLVIDHLCRNRACVNPVHMEPVTQAVNHARGEIAEVTRKRHKAKAHCKQGHEFTPENTYMTSDGKRQCRTCKAERAKGKPYDPEVYRRWKAKRGGAHRRR